MRGIAVLSTDAAESRPPARRIVRRLVSLFVAGSTVLVLAPIATATAATPVVYQANDSGYTVFSATVQPTSSVSAQFVVPRLSDCGSTSPHTSVAFGVLEETTASFTNVVEPFLRMDCVRGRPVYGAGYKFPGVLQTLPAIVSPGDVIALSASTTSTAGSITFTDVTTGYSKTVTGSGVEADYAYVGSLAKFDDAGIMLGVPRFTSFSFTNTQVNGANLDTYSAATGLEQFIRTTNGTAPPSGIIQIQPGAPAAASFTETWLHQ